MSYRIIAVGKVRKGWIQDGISMYLKRLPGITITEVRDTHPQREAQAIQTALRSSELLVALCEEGEALASVPLAERLEK
ncbi:MAG TPA: 23S rRNA (pseudouridine(1915)-N(3))-methyltransferase RlmH, partial [Prochlorococcus sp.]